MDPVQFPNLLEGHKDDQKVFKYKKKYSKNKIVVLKFFQ